MSSTNLAAGDFVSLAMRVEKSFLVASVGGSAAYKFTRAVIGLQARPGANYRERRNWR